MSVDPSLLTAAIETRLDSQLSVPVSVGEADNTSDLRVVIYPVGDADILDKLNTPAIAGVFEYQIVSVGWDAAGAEHLGYLVRDALIGWRPTVTNVTTGQMSISGGRGVQRDDDLPNQGDASFSNVDIFSLFALDETTFP